MSTVLVWNPSTKKYPARPASISQGTAVGWMGPYKPTLMGANDVWTCSTLPVYAPPAPPAPTPAPVTGKTILGCSGTPIPGVPQRGIGTWMSRDTWRDLLDARWLTAPENDLTGYLAAHPDGIVDIGVPIVPHNGKSAADKNALLDQLVSNATVDTTDYNGTHPATSGTTHDVLTALGAGLAKAGPATVVARLWWEQNLEGIDPAKYVAGFNVAAPLIRAGFASAARPGQKLLVSFSPNYGSPNWRDYLPADASYDILAPDVYGKVWAATPPTVADMVGQAKTYLDDVAAFAASKGKRVGLGEWANWSTGPADGQPNVRGCGDCPEFVQMVLDWCDANHALLVTFYNIADGTGLTLADTPRSLAVLQAWSAK